MARYMLIFSDSEIERIYAGARRVVGNVGFRVQHRPILERLEALGARVDYPGQIFWPSPQMLDAVGECARRHAPRQLDPAPLRRLPPAGEHLTFNGTLYYDWAEGEQRPATLRDVQDMLRLCHVLPEVSALGPTMTAQDVAAPIEPMASLAEAIALTDKPITGVETILASQIPYLEELDSIATEQPVRYRDGGAAINRLTLDERAAECLYALSQRHGLASWVTSSCPVAGASAPVTLAGSVVVAVAETIGSWLAGWALNQDVSLGAIPCSGVMDMRTTRVLFSTPEAVLIDAGLYQVLDRLFGVQTGMLADYTDAKVPGLQAMHDKVFKSLAYYWLTGQNRRHKGMLEAGKAFSPTELIIDLELNSELDRLLAGTEVDDEALALDEIEACGLDFGKSYLDREHTLLHFRRSVWEPRLMDRTCWEGGDAERRKEQALLRLAEERWRDSLASYEQPYVPEEKVRAARQVVERARRALL